MSGIARRLRLLAVILVVIPTAQSVGQQPIGPTLSDIAREFVLQIQCGMTFVGTGFVIQGGKVITAEHVAGRCEVGRLVLTLGATAVGVSERSVDDRLDIALLKPSSPLPAHALPFGTPLSPKSRIAICGFPEQPDNTLTLICVEGQHIEDRIRSPGLADAHSSGTSSIYPLGQVCLEARLSAHTTVQSLACSLSAMQSCLISLPHQAKARALGSALRI